MKILLLNNVKNIVDRIKKHIFAKSKSKVMEREFQNITFKLDDRHYIIWKCFVRVMKEASIYNRFLKSCYQFSYKENLRGDSYKNLGYKIYDDLADKAKSYMTSEIQENCDKYAQEVVIINTLLKFLLEDFDINCNKLGMYGQVIFNLSCCKIYGKQFINDINKLLASDGVKNKCSKNRIDYNMFNFK